MFIFTHRNEIIQWNGKNANPFEKLRASRYATDLVSSSNGRLQKRTVEQNGQTDEADLDTVVQCMGPMPSHFPPGLPDEHRTKPMTHTSQKSKIYSIKSTTPVVVGIENFEQSVLREDECFVVTHQDTVYVWKGQCCTPVIRHSQVQQFLNDISGNGLFIFSSVMTSSVILTTK